MSYICTYHLSGDVQHSFEVELATALLKQVFKTFPKQVHHHDVIHFPIFCLLVSDEVKEGHEGLASQLVDQLTLPEEHDVTLHLHCFLLKAWNDKRASQRVIRVS